MKSSASCGDSQAWMQKYQYKELKDSDFAVPNLARKRNYGDSKASLKNSTSTPTLPKVKVASSTKARIARQSKEELDSIRKSIVMAEKPRHRKVDVAAKEAKQECEEDRRQGDLERWSKMHGLDPGVQVNLKDKIALRKWFRLLDEDSSGEVSVQELQDPLISAGILRTREQVTRTLKNADVNCSNGIDFKEFLDALHGNVLADKSRLKKLQNMSANPHFSMDTLLTEERRKQLFSIIIGSNQKREEEIDAVWHKDKVLREHQHVPHPHRHHGHHGNGYLSPIKQSTVTGPTAESETPSHPSPHAHSHYSHFAHNTANAHTEKHTFEDTLRELVHVEATHDRGKILIDRSVQALTFALKAKITQLRHTDDRKLERLMKRNGEARPVDAPEPVIDNVALPPVLPMNALERSTDTLERNRLIHESASHLPHLPVVKVPHPVKMTHQVHTHEVHHRRVQPLEGTSPRGTHHTHHTHHAQEAHHASQFHKPVHNPHKHYAPVPITPLYENSPDVRDGQRTQESIKMISEHVQNKIKRDHVEHEAHKGDSDYASPTNFGASRFANSNFSNKKKTTIVETLPPLSKTKTTSKNKLKLDMVEPDKYHSKASRNDIFQAVDTYKSSSTLPLKPGMDKQDYDTEYLHTDAIINHPDSTYGHQAGCEHDWFEHHDAQLTHTIDEGDENESDGDYDADKEQYLSLLSNF